MGAYRRMPTIIEAEQWFTNTGRGVKGVCHSAHGGAIYPGVAHVHTMHDNQRVNLQTGDWVVMESDGEHFYPIKPDVFAATYEPVEPGGASLADAEVVTKKWVAKA